LVHHCLPVFDEICGMAINVVLLFIGVTLIKSSNVPLDRSAALVLSVINYYILQLHWHLPNLARNLAETGLSWIFEKWLDSSRAVPSNSSNASTRLQVGVE